MAAALGALPSSASILGNTPGASTGHRQRMRQQGQPAQGVQPGTQQDQSAQPQTFAQLQQQGRARPAPPASPQYSQMGGYSGGYSGITLKAPPEINPHLEPPPTGGAGGFTPPSNPQGNPTIPTGFTPSGAGGGYGGPGGIRPPTLGPGGTANGNFYGGYNGQLPPQGGGGYDAGSAAPGIQGTLQSQVQNALQTPSRYNLPEVQQVRDALTSQLNTQFGAQQKQLEEQMARRGISASSIAGGYYGDLEGQQANALSQLNANLIENQAATAAGDQTASIGAGQNYLNSANQNALNVGNLTGNFGGAPTLAGQLGLGQLGLSQGALTGMYGGAPTLAASSAANQYGLDVGNLSGTFNGSPTLAGQQFQTGAQQFQQQLEQALGISTMQDKTANRGVDANHELATNQLYLQIANILMNSGLLKKTDSSDGTVTTTGTGSAGGGSNGETGDTGHHGDTGNNAGLTPSSLPFSGFTGGSNSLNSLYSLFNPRQYGQTTGGTSSASGGQYAPRAGETMAQTIARMQKPDPATGGGPLTGPDADFSYLPQDHPIQRYLRGEIDYATMQRLNTSMAQQHGDLPLQAPEDGQSSNLSQYTDEQILPSIDALYQRLLKANNGNVASAKKAIIGYGSGGGMTYDPRVAALVQKRYGGA